VLSTREIRRKIRSVRNIQQICRATKTIAGIKLVRAERRLAACRRYSAMLDDALRDACRGAQHPLLSRPETQARAVILITADRGLCGSYNLNAMRRAASEWQAAPDRLITVGKKGTDFFRRRAALAASLSPLGAEPSPAQVRALARQALRMFLAGDVGQVLAIWTRFLGGMRGRLEGSSLLPIEPAGEPATTEALFEPRQDQLLDLLLPRYFEHSLWRVVLESSASEHASRVAAMTLATDNAEEVINNLTLEFNKARQAAITKELLDIVGTAEALR